MANGTATASSGAVSAPLQPQTTGQGPGGPFIRYSNPGSRAMYTNSYTNTQWAATITITSPLVAAPGYLRKFRPIITASGGASTLAVASADAPFNLVSLAQLKDAYGNPLVICSGYSLFKLIPLFGGQFGVFDSADVVNLPSYSAVSTAGNFNFAGSIPAEFAKGYGVISMANATALPSLQLNLNTPSVVYSTSPSTIPALSIDMEADFYWLPTPASQLPPGLGTTLQWLEVQMNPPVGSSASMRVQLTRLGGYVTTVVLIARDSTNARIDTVWPARVQLFIDGIPVLDDPIAKVYDDMKIAFGSGNPSWTRPTGVIAYSRKLSLAQTSLGLLDTGEGLLSTNPGTLIELNGSPFGTVANSPAQITALLGIVVPVSELVTGLPEA
jgi:hypothetical protein